jgi:hypothetical protein
MIDKTTTPETISVWGISDIHIDYQENFDALLDIPIPTEKKDALIIAGDATDNIDRLEELLTAMKQRFRWVGFVPGNHELWIREKNKSNTSFSNSIDKFDAIIAMCGRIDVFTKPQKVGVDTSQIWLVPLFSWYHGPEESSASLYAEKKCKQDKTREIWSDFFLTQWPEWKEGFTADYFLKLNKPHLEQEYSYPVLSFSHFLPLQELMLPSEQEQKASTLLHKDLTPEFNFSRVAGTTIIDEQLRKIDSKMHLYRHQHRNRYREVNGVTYVSHCMGYPKERKRGLIAEHCAQPKLLWDSTNGFY